MDYEKLRQANILLKKQALGFPMPKDPPTSPPITEFKAFATYWFLEF